LITADTSDDPDLRVRRLQWLLEVQTHTVEGLLSEKRQFGKVIEDIKLSFGSESTAQESEFRVETQGSSSVFETFGECSESQRLIEELFSAF